MRRILFLLIMGIGSMYAREENEVEHVLEGNLTLPTSQQPSPLYAIGQDIVDKHDFQIFGLYDYLRGCNKKYSEVLSSALYGITDNLSFFLGIPAAASFKLDGSCSSGIEDMYLQMEYAFFNKDAERYAIQSTLVNILVLPTGSFHKNPPTGAGYPTFVVGGTTSVTSPSWYAFVCAGGVFPTNSQQGQIPKKLLYQGGLSYNVAYAKEKWMLTLGAEMYGSFSKNGTSTTGLHTALFGGHTGGNIVYLGPVLWFSTQRFILQAGVMVPISQPCNSPNKSNYWPAVSVGWKFH